MGLPPELAFVFGDVPTTFHRTRVVSRAMVAESTLALTIERPSGFTFTPGQNVMISIPGAQAEHLKEFTLASAPCDEHLMIAMRVRNSNFKHTAYALAAGDAIMVRDPGGVLWERTGAPQVWLSGGIGITPFRSILRELIRGGEPLAVTHIHSDRSRASIPFCAEFESVALEQAGYSFIPTLTREGASGILRGRITADLIRTSAPHVADSQFYIVGTDAFVGAMRDALHTLEVHSSQIHTERFDGYKVREN
jgi:ferredoxin-NADP reductase